jgi:peroxiredoxin
VHGGKTDYRFVLPAVGGGASTLWPKLKTGEPAPPLKVVTLDGTALTLADLKGKWVLLDFWATWCLPCRQQVPHLQAVHKAYGSRRDFVMISISLDDDEQALRKFIQENSLDWHQVFGEKGGARKAADAYGASAIPLTVILNPQGDIEAVDPPGSTLKETVGRFLGDEKQQD